jgi:hypothetical protein
MSEGGILFVHLIGVFLFVGGSMTASALRFSALKIDNPTEIATLLKTVRPIVRELFITILIN